MPLCFEVIGHSIAHIGTLPPHNRPKYPIVALMTGEIRICHLSDVAVLGYSSSPSCSNEIHRVDVCSVYERKCPQQRLKSDYISDKVRGVVYNDYIV